MRTSPRHSVRRQLVIRIVIALTTLCVITNTVFFLYLKQLGSDAFDSRLRKDLEVIAAMTSVHDNGRRIALAMHQLDHPEFRDHSGGKYYHLSHDEHDVHVRSQSLTEVSLPRHVENSNRPVLRNLQLPNGRKGRLITTKIAFKEQGSGDTPSAKTVVHQIHIAVAISREELDQLLMMELLGSMTVSALLILIALGIVSGFATKSFESINQFTEKLQSTDYQNLSRRDIDHATPSELLPLEERFNNLLDRLREGVEREQRFNDNIAHELRTPIAELRAIVEVGCLELDGDTLPGATKYFQDLTEITARMSRLVDTVFLLSRPSGANEEIALERVGLKALVDKTWAPHHAFASRKEIKTQMDVPATLSVITDQALASAVLTNLIANAVYHSPEQGSIAIRSFNEADDVTLTIENQNTALTAGDLNRLTEPFWQKDPSRQGGERSGIGMALVDSYCRALKIECTFTLPEPHVFRVTLRFVSGARATSTQLG